MKEVPNFYVVEGLDGVGKTTVLGKLEERGFLVFQTPSTELKKLRRIFDSQNTRIRFLYYLLGVLFVGEEIGKIKKDERKVCDRYLLTTLAAHEAMGIDPTFISSLIPLIESVPKPEKTILLTATEDVRLGRLNKRGMNKVDIKNFEINGEILKGYKCWSEKLDHNLEEIDTTNLDVVEVADAIEALISKNE